MSSSDKILPDLSSIRRMIRERLTGMTSMTEREVLAAGQSLNDVVARARDHVELTREILEAAAGTGPGNAHASIASQSEAMRRFLAEMSNHLTAQKQHAAVAHSRSTEIGSTAKSMGALAHAAHILSLTTKLETARSTQVSVDVFSAISEEMQKLSVEVQSANAQISDLGSELVEAIPQVSSLAARMEALTQEFSQHLSESIERVREEERCMRENILAVLQAGDQVLAQVLARAGESLSHLQFQDSTAQGLLEIDRWLYELEDRVAKCLNVDVERAPPLQITIGSGNDYDSANAGALTLL